ncbi:unnamed protein product, partial [Porites evermanni]
TKGKPQQASQGISSFRRDFWSRRIQNTMQMRRKHTVIKRHVDLKRKELKLQPTQKALLIWDVFKGQKTDKRFMKDQFTMWYSAEIQKPMEATENDDDIEVDLRLSVLKPLHASWLVSLYNHLR